MSMSDSAALTMTAVSEMVDSAAAATASAESSMHFKPIVRADSVPDVTGDEATSSNGGGKARQEAKAKFDLSLKVASGHHTSSASMMMMMMESPSPAGSIDQYEAAATPLSPDDMEVNREAAGLLSSSGGARFVDAQLNPSFKFRRHSSQSSLNMPANLSSTSAGSASGSLTLLPTTNSTSCLSERICSSPVNSLKMSSRVCQIKIDEGIGPHLREIRSERETQNTLKLKSSCDELMINNEDLELAFDGAPRTSNDTLRYSAASPNSVILPTSTTTTFRRYRTFSETLGGGNAAASAAIAAGQQISQSNMPSPSMSSCYSYSNSSSPTGCINPPSVTPGSGGLLRCFSPSTAAVGVGGSSLLTAQPNQLLQNYFSKSPSPTRKLFVTRRSMSPIPLRPSTLNTAANSNNKRKFADIETDLPDAQSACSPKRSNNDSQQEFVQPLLINTKNVLSAVRSNTSSPSSSAATTPLSHSQSSSLSSLIITAGTPMSGGGGVAGGSLSAKTTQTKMDEGCPISGGGNGAASDKDLFVWPASAKSTPGGGGGGTASEEDSPAGAGSSSSGANKYTFVPIQLPPPRSTSPFLLNPPTSFPSSNGGGSNGGGGGGSLFLQQQRKRASVGAISSCTSFSALAQLNLQNGGVGVGSGTGGGGLMFGNSPLNSPARCDSPASYSPSVSNISSSNGTADKPDSGYQSSLQNNSDSESACNL